MAVELHNIAIIILAAGASKRMGVPKQTLLWKDTNLIGHSIQTALKVPVKEVCVVLGAYYEILNNDIKQYPIKILHNKDWELGLGSSIASGIMNLNMLKCNVDGVLIMLADQPFVSSGYLESLIQNFEVGKNQIMATYYAEGKNGVPAIFDTVYFNELLELEEDYGAKYLLHKHRLKVKTLMPPYKNVDLDTEEMYQRYYKLQFKN